jgi:peptidylprolyl isomerase
MMRLGSLVLAFALLGSMGARADEWRDVDPENLVLIDVSYGRIAIELTPKFAPKTVDRFRALVRAKFYDTSTFYRVIDGFVAQGGIGEGDDKKLAEWPPLMREFERVMDDDVTFTGLATPDFYATETGFVDGLPAARDEKENKVWLVHCYGAVAIARDDAPDTGATEFYVVIGHSPRRLDRNLTVFGKVLEGMEYLQKLNRGNPEVESGVIQDPAKRDPIVKAQIAADMPKSERPRYQVMRTDSDAFAKRVEERRHPASPFFFRKPPPMLDVCNVSVPVRHAPPLKKKKRSPGRK